MGSFNASLRTMGDRRGLPATVTIDDGRLVIEAGDHPIGDWSLEEIHLEATGGSSYRMAAEGEHIIIDVPDIEAFQSALRARAKFGRRPKVRSEKTPRPEPRVDDARAERSAVEKEHTKKTRAKKARPVRIETKAVRAKSAKPVTDEAPRDRWARAQERLDQVLEAAERKWGALLPSWMFTRVMAIIVFVSLILMVVLPGLVSSLLLISGLILVLLGAIAYTDEILAAKWLPGRMTSMHVLLFGVAVVMMGVLLGMLA
jgi:hypothetical protein